MPFLIEALKHDVPAFHEDRLTQVLSATFNSSAHFRKHFLKFLAIPYRPHLKSKTQVSDRFANSRPDIVISGSNGRPYVLIESKVEARATKAQQNRHLRHKSKYCFLITRDPVDQKQLGKTFRKVSWCDFFNFLARVEHREEMSAEAFLVSELIEYGRACDMVYPDRITVEEMEVASSFVTALRLRINPSIGLGEPSPFRALDNITLFLERVITSLKEDPFFAKRAKNLSRGFGLGTTKDLGLAEDRRKNRGSARMIAMASDGVAIQRYMDLKRKTNGHSTLFLLFQFVPYFKNKEVSDFDLKKLLSLDIKYVKYRGELVAGLCSSDLAWTKFFSYDDRHDLNFFTISKEAKKFWKRYLS